MLNSKINKKIFFFIFIFTFFIIFFSFSNKIQAQNNTLFWYCYGDQTEIDNKKINNIDCFADGSKKAQEFCKIDREKKIENKLQTIYLQTSGLSSDLAISECKKSNKNPAPLNTLGSFKKINQELNITKLFWYEYLILSSQKHHIFGPFLSMDGCNDSHKNVVEDNTNYKEHRTCFESSTVPILTPNPHPLSSQGSQENTSQINTKTTYTPLAELPGLKGAYDTTGDCPFGKYFNIIFKLFLGLAAVFAMIMIVMGGIEYMTSELVSSKQKGKERIMNAVFGLILAFGAYAIINTINPDLLNACLGGRRTVSIEIMDEQEIYDSNPQPPNTTGINACSGPTHLCTKGLKKFQVGSYWFCMCSEYNGVKIADQTEKLIKDALNNGRISLAGGGYRDDAYQNYLRKKNCYGNTTDPNAPCKTPTALAGKSMHNSGLAIDFTCFTGTGFFSIDRIEAPKTTNCFEWLDKNAKKYGLVNLKTSDPAKKEDWHWSINGK